MQTNLTPIDSIEILSPKKQNPDCSVSHCTIQANSAQPGAFCDGHYQKAYRGIDPEGFSIRDSGLADVACAFSDCGLRARRSGLCTKHHKAVMTGREPAPEGVVVQLSAKCAFGPCQQRANSYKEGSFCQTHYVQKNRGVELMDSEQWGRYTRGEVDCAVGSCDRKAKTRELCSVHYSMLATYGVTVTELVQLRGIAVCQNPACDSTYRLCIDHDHETGLVRTILCSNCNSALGHAKDDADRLRGLAEYIELHGS